jgi:hypothetical protein
MNHDPQEHFSQAQLDVVEDIFVKKFNAMLVRFVIGNLVVIVGGIAFFVNQNSRISHHEETLMEQASDISELQSSDINNRVVLSSIQTDISAIKASLLRLEAGIKR